MKKLLLFSALLLVSYSYGQTFEITGGQSMCMLGKGQGQDATINPYADEDYSYAIIENIGSVEFQVRIESIKKDLTQYSIKPNCNVALKLYRNNILYLDALTLEKGEARIKYAINEKEIFKWTNGKNKVCNK